MNHGIIASLSFYTLRENEKLPEISKKGPNLGLSIDRLLFGLVSEFLRERSPAMIVRQLPLAARLTLRVGTRAGPTLSTSDDGRKETDYQS